MASGDHRQQALGGVLLGFASCTRPEGIFLALSVAVVLAIAPRWFGMRRGHGALLLGPPALMALLWLIFLRMHGASTPLSGPTSSLYRAWSGGNMGLPALSATGGFFARDLLDWKSWGLTLPLLPLMLILQGKRAPLNNSGEATLLFSLSLTVITLIAGYFYVASFHGNLPYLLGTSGDRLMIPSVGLAILAALLLASCGVQEGS